MECRDTERLMDAYLDRELGPEETRQVELHVSGCSACRSRHGVLLTLLGSARPVSVPDGLRDRIVAAVASGAGQGDSPGMCAEPRWGGLWVFRAPWSGAAAASVMLMFAGWFVLQFSGKPPRGMDTTTPIAQPAGEPVAPSPWMLMSWAQARSLPGPGGSTAFLVQGMAMELLTRPVPDEAPLISVRRPMNRDAGPLDSEPSPAVPQVPFIVAGVSSLASLGV